MANYAFKPFTWRNFLINSTERMPVSFAFVLTLEGITYSDSRVVTWIRCAVTSMVGTGKCILSYNIWQMALLDYGT